MVKGRLFVCWLVKERHCSGNKGTFESGQYKSEVCSNVLEDRESKRLLVTMEQNCSSLLKVVSTRVKCVLKYSKIEKATVYWLPWNKIAILYLQRNKIS